MSTDRTAQLTPQERAIKLALREAVEAAGGQVFVAREIDRTQSRVSDWVSENTAEFMPVHLVERVEALGAGTPGHPHVTRALARARGMRIAAPGAATLDGLDDLGDWLATIAREHADLSALLAGHDLAQAAARLSPAAKAALSREAGQLVDVLERLRRSLAADDPRGLEGDTS